MANGGGGGNGGGIAMSTYELLALLDECGIAYPTYATRDMLSGCGGARDVFVGASTSPAGCR